MFRIIHTADWHLGHHFHGISRAYEHRQFLYWLLEQLEEQQADALIIAGDIFDSANPPASAESMFYDFLIEVREILPQLSIVIIGGNHDSAARLNAPAQLLKRMDITVIGGLKKLKGGEIDWQSMVVPLKNKQGEVKAICGAMPFIRNPDLSLNPQSKYQDELVDSVAYLYEQLCEAMQDYCEQQDLPQNVKQIMTGHCYMIGTSLSEMSERRILGGNQHALPASIFNNAIDYVALGHLHKAQRVRASDDGAIYYSGSPIPFSFTEINYQHQVTCVSFDKQGEPSIEGILVPRTVALEIIPKHGYALLNEIPELIDARDFVDLNASESLAKDNYPLLEIRVKLDKPEPDLRQKIEQLVENKAVRLLKISTEYPGRQDSLADQSQLKQLNELQPIDVFEQCYKRQFEQMPADNLKVLFNELLESIQVDD